MAAGTESFELDFNKEATHSTEGDIDTDNDNYDSTSRKLTDGLNDGVIAFALNTMFVFVVVVQIKTQELIIFFLSIFDLKQNNILAFY